MKRIASPRGKPSCLRTSTVMPATTSSVIFSLLKRVTVGVQQQARSILHECSAVLLQAQLLQHCNSTAAYDGFGGSEPCAYNSGRSV